MLVLSIKFGPTKSGNKRAKQWDVRNLTMNTESFRISNCEAEDRSDCHCTGVAIAELGWDRTHTNTHTPHTHTIHTHHKHTHSTHAHTIHTHTTNTHIYICIYIYEGWNFNSGNYLFTTDTK